MSKPNCPRCEGTSFTHELHGDVAVNYCRGCGAILGLIDTIPQRQLEDLAKRIARIEHAVTELQKGFRLA